MTQPASQTEAKTGGYSSLTRLAVVRASHSEQSVWRSALGDQASLHVWSADGPLDVPQHLPAGGMRSTPQGPQKLTSQRAA